jgi:histone H2A
MAQRCGLVFPVGRVRSQLRSARYAQRIAVGAPIYLAAVLEYLAAELLELAGNSVRDLGKKRILPRHVQIALRADVELAALVGDDTAISGGGARPSVGRLN